MEIEMEIATHCEHSWEFQFFLEMKMEMEIDMHCVRAIISPIVLSVTDYLE